MISKELLSEVLKIGIDTVGHNTKNNNLYYSFSKHSTQYINLYELAHRCKEWALKLDYKLSSSMTDGRYDECVLRICMGNELLFEADTEQEAIFKACQWILENR